MSDKGWYVGCACDRAFVQHTAVMLTSLAINGAVPEATILIAAFEFEAADYDRLRAAAGPFGADVRFVDVTPAMLGRVAELEWEAHYSLPIFGRLFLHELIDEPGARLLTLDSDMVVNRSVRSLFEMNLLGNYVAAVHDLPRTDDYDYFNSGLMLVDVDTYRRYRVAERCLDWVAEQADRPRWPDQDALNYVVGHKWFRLSNEWNRHFCGTDLDPEPLTPAFYQNAIVAHFTGKSKPWNNTAHVGRELYEGYLASFVRQREIYLAAKNNVDSNFIVTACEILLGRTLRSDTDFEPFARISARQLVERLVHSSEFASEILLPLRLGVPFDGKLYDFPFGARHRRFAAERFIMHPLTAETIKEAKSWRQLIDALLLDPFFRAAYRLEPLVALADAAQQYNQIQSLPVDAA